MNIADYVKSLGIEGEFPPVKTETRKYLKGDDVISIGDTEKNLYYIVSGIVEVGMFSKNDEKILEFVFPNTFTSSFTSLIVQKPSDTYITCLTDCVVNIVPFSEIREATKTSLAACQFYIKCIEYAHIVRVRKEKDFMLLNAEERYLKLIKTRPEIMQQVPVYRIAKYLGIHPDSLSRIKKKLSSPT